MVLNHKVSISIDIFIFHISCDICYSCFTNINFENLDRGAFNFKVPVEFLLVYISISVQ